MTTLMSRTYTLENEILDFLEDGAGKIRALRLGLDIKRPRLKTTQEVPKTPSLQEDFKKVVATLQEDTGACLMVIRLKDDRGTIPAASDTDVAVISRIPKTMSQGERQRWAPAFKSVAQGKDSLRNISIEENIAWEDFLAVVTGAQANGVDIPQAPVTGTTPDAKPPSEGEFAAKALELKKVEVKEAGGAVDPQVMAVYKKVYEECGGDKEKVCGKLGLDAKKWVEIDSADAFTVKYLGVQ